MARKTEYKQRNHLKRLTFLVPSGVIFYPRHVSMCVITNSDIYMWCRFMCLRINTGKTFWCKKKFFSCPAVVRNPIWRSPNRKYLLSQLLDEIETKFQRLTPHFPVRSENIRCWSIEKLDPENVGLAVEISFLSHLGAEIISISGLATALLDF